MFPKISINFKHKIPINRIPRWKMKLKIKINNKILKLIPKFLIKQTYNIPLLTLKPPHNDQEFRENIFKLIKNTLLIN